MSVTHHPKSPEGVRRIRIISVTIFLTTKSPERVVRVRTISVTPSQGEH